MGIYDENKFVFAGLKIDPSQKLFKYIATAIAVVIIAIIVLSVGSNLLKPDPFRLIFSKNPLDLSKEQNVLLKIQITNITEEKAENVLVKIVPEDNVSLLVFPIEETIAVLGKGETRELLFTIRPDPRSEILTGQYKINIYAVINGEEFSKQSKIYIKTA